MSKFIIQISVDKQYNMYYNIIVIKDIRGKFNEENKVNRNLCQIKYLG